MLRRYIQAARRHRHHRQYRREHSPLSSLASASWNFSSSEDSDGNKPRLRSHHHTSNYYGRPHPLLTTIPIIPRYPCKRYFGISRHPDPLDGPRAINTLDEDDNGDEETVVVGGATNFNPYTTADALEYDDPLLSPHGAAVELGGGNLLDGGGSYGDIEDNSQLDNFWDDEDGIGGEEGKGRDMYENMFGGGYNDDDDDEDGDGLKDGETKEEVEYHARQLQIKKELDKRTGRLWTDEWIITDEEWMTSQSFEDIEEWSPQLATRKSLESVKVFEGGVPTLEQLGRLELPRSLPPHPGHGDPNAYAKYRKRRL